MDEKVDPRIVHTSRGVGHLLARALTGFSCRGFSYISVCVLADVSVG